MRWLGSWTLYWLGHLAYLIGDRAGIWPGEFWYEVYQRVMDLSARVQGYEDCGPWGVKDNMIYDSTSNHEAGTTTI